MLENVALLRREQGKMLCEPGITPPPSFINKLITSVGQIDVHPPPIVAIRLSCDEPGGHESIDGAIHARGGHPFVFAERPQ